MAETLSEEGYRYEVAFVNPASNTDAASVLRLVNRSETEASVTITGTDDAGEAGAVTLTLPAGASRRLWAPELESGEGEGLDGALGDGAGKWRLAVDSDQPLAVMNLMRSLEGHLTNLSTAPRLAQRRPRPMLACARRRRGWGGWVDLDALRRESANDAVAEHGVMLTSRIRR